MQFAPKRESVLQTIVKSVECALRGPQSLHRHIQLSSELEMNSISRTTVSKTIDLATSYFGPFGAALEVVALVQNLLPEAVATRIRDPMKAEHIAKRATLRKRLGCFMTTDTELVEHLGYDTVLGIREALYRRLIIEDKLLLRLLRRKSYSIEELLDNKSLVSHTDLERLWTATALINPATLRDALIDLAYHSGKTVSRDSTNQDRSFESLPVKSWKVLHLIMGSRMNFADVYFLCATAQEFMSTMVLATFHESQFASLLPRGRTGTEPLILCMRALGIFVTYWSLMDGRELVVGLMENNSSTRTFARTISNKSNISIRIRYFNGTVFRNDESLEDLDHGDCNEEPKAIRVNLEGVDGQPIRELYRRTDQEFRDGFEIRLAPKNNGGDKSDAWKLDLLHDLALIQTGRRDVCAALDYSFDKIRRQSCTTADLSFLSNRRRFSITQKSLTELKNNFSQCTLAVPNKRSRSQSTNDQDPPPSKARLSRHLPFPGSVEFQHRNTRPTNFGTGKIPDEFDKTDQNVPETRRQRLAKSKFREHLSLSTEVTLSNIATDIQHYKSRVQGRA
ncbi:protein of unknown function [Taphrina deformans PYCC 5710]|uniref:Uncharacterized protein n=1 Tax=Taphrina deformans (strain PYCC 5710 / ATCC 11124 / CBS 356.35 / IMI 108563 / JCM 9778 / NBRC 8474) TaxID=1097556 RepID=R4XDV0_TAPDE|nr:protein of unknown function [Taphrina deformans PYCC 5710]|eukprot:CCG82595.1 protein of unknown function [Taphrina deformans PYCC 5710]